MRKSKQQEVKETVIKDSIYGKVTVQELDWIKAHRRHNAPNVETAEEYYADGDMILLEFKYAYDLHDIFGERLLNELISNLRKHTSYESDQIKGFQHKGSLISNWNRDKFLEEKIDRMKATREPMTFKDKA